MTMRKINNCANCNKQFNDGDEYVYSYTIAELFIEVDPLCWNCGAEKLLNLGFEHEAKCIMHVSEKGALKINEIKGKMSWMKEEKR